MKFKLFFVLMSMLMLSAMSVVADEYVFNSPTSNDSFSASPYPDGTFGCVSNCAYGRVFYDYNYSKVLVPNIINVSLRVGSNYYEVPSSCYNNNLEDIQIRFWYPESYHFYPYPDTTIIMCYNTTAGTNSYYEPYGYPIFALDRTNLLMLTDSSLIVNYISCTENWVGGLVPTTCETGEQTLVYVDTNNCGTTNDLPVDNGTVGSCTADHPFNPLGVGGTIDKSVEGVKNAIIVSQDALSNNANADSSGLSSFLNKIWNFIAFWR